jgi:hypothetical protein
MAAGKTNAALEHSFPPPPVRGSDLLVPLLSPEDMARDAMEMNIPYEPWDDEEVRAHVAYFFSWRGIERATVLTVFVPNKELTNFECQAYSEASVMPSTLKAIHDTVTKLFRAAGFEINLKTACL